MASGQLICRKAESRVCPAGVGGSFGDSKVGIGMFSTAPARSALTSIARTTSGSKSCPGPSGRGDCGLIGSDVTALQSAFFCGSLNLCLGRIPVCGHRHFGPQP